MFGVLDRFEDQKAVILMEDQKEEIIVDRHDLPKGSKENTYFNLEKQPNGTYTIVSIDEEKTKAEATKTTNLMEKLRNKNSGSKFKKRP